MDISALNVSELNSAAVKKTGDQTIAGVKTFSDNVGNSTTATQLA